MEVQDIKYSDYLPETAAAFDGNNIVLAYHVADKHKKAIFNRNGNLLIDDCSRIVASKNHYFVDGIIFDKDFQPVIDLETSLYKRRRFVDIFEDGVLLYNNEKSNYEILSISQNKIISELDIQNTKQVHSRIKVFCDKYLKQDGFLYDLDGKLISENVHLVYDSYYMKVVETNKISLVDYNGNILVEKSDSMIATNDYYGYSLDKNCYVYKSDGTKMFELLDKGFKVANIINDSLIVLLKYKDDSRREGTYYIVENGTPKLKYTMGEYTGFLKNSQVLYRLNNKVCNIKTGKALTFDTTCQFEYGNDTLFIFNEKNIHLYDVDFNKIATYKNTEYLENITVLNSRKEKLKDLLSW